MPEKTYYCYTYYENQLQPKTFVLGKYELFGKDQIVLKEATYAPIQSAFKEEYDPELSNDSIKIVINLTNNINDDYSIGPGKLIYFIINDNICQKSATHDTTLNGVFVASYAIDKIKKVENIRTIKILAYPCPTLESPTFYIHSQNSNKYTFNIRNDNILSKYGGIGDIDSVRSLNFGDGNRIPDPLIQYFDTLKILNHRKLEGREIYRRFR